MEGGDHSLVSEGSKMKKLHPTQDIILDSNNTPRFRKNAIVNSMLEMGKLAGIFNLNTLALQQYSDEDRMQLAQLIGYSISGYGDLSYVSDESYSEAEKMAEIKMKNSKVCLEPKDRKNEFPASIPSGSAQPVVVSEEFIQALRQAGARESIIDVLVKERANSEFKLGSAESEPSSHLRDSEFVCCSFMEANLKQKCDQHSKFECPDVIVIRNESGGFGIPIHDGGDSFITILFCPWCGKELSG